MSWQTDLGDQIRKAREKAGLSQEQLASNLTVTREQLSNYERGKSAIPANVIAEIAEALGIGFVIGNCRIAMKDLKRPAPGTPAQQLCFSYGVEHRFAGANVTIRPIKGSLLIKATMRRSRIA
jgi:transcriptional regulator with XRE-family HTH domain